MPWGCGVCRRADACAGGWREARSIKLLLTGAPRTGKSALVRRLLEAYPGNAGGILATEIAGLDGKRCGFELQAIWSAPGESLRVLDRAVLAHVSSTSAVRVGRYGVNEEGLRLAVSALDGAMHEGGLVVIDAIGPLQVISPEFRDAVLRCLDSRCHMLGTIAQGDDPFLAQVRAHPAVKLVEVTRVNRSHLVGGLLTWLSGPA